jgi:hypothetical protein
MSRTVLFLVSLLLGSLLLLVGSHALAQTRAPQSHRVVFNRGKPGLFGGKWSYAVDFKADGSPSKLSTNFFIMKPCWLTLQNKVLFDRTRTIKLTGRPGLQRALRTLHQSAAKTGASALHSAGDHLYVHWQPPATSTNPPRNQAAAFRAAREVQRLLR